LVSVAEALRNLADQLPADQGPAERVTIVQANEHHYVGRVEYGDEEDFDGYQILLQSESASEA
jgi:hypothetical protein